MLLSNTQLLSTAVPTTSSASGQPTTATLGGDLFYAASDGSGGTGYELWKTDGTPAGTVLVKDINPGKADSFPLGFVVNGNRVFFTANDGTHGNQVWETDGSGAGTVMVTPSGTSYTSPWNLTSVNGKVFFTANDASGQSSLWVTDGTPSGTVELAQVGAADLTNVNGTLFFAGTDAQHGMELWKSDGTSQGTVLVKDIVPGAASSSPSNLTADNGEAFFTITDASSGTALPELWKSDGTAAGTVLVKQTSARSLYAFNGSVYFIGGDAVGNSGYENLWKTDGTSAGTVQVTEFHTVQTDFYTQNYAVVNGTLLIAEYNLFNDVVQLYRSDGTQAGTVPIAPGVTLDNSQYDYESKLVVANGLAYFISPGVIYQTDGTPAGTEQADPSAASLVNPIHLMGVAGNTLVFSGVPSGSNPFINQSVYGMAIPPAPVGTAKFVGIGSSAQGSWQGVYGSSGYDLLDGPSSLPADVVVTASNAQPWTWQDPSSDPRALQDPAPSTSRTAACDYSQGGFSLDVNITDQQSYQVALYVVDFDGRGRNESVQIRDGNSGQVLDTQSVSNFQAGRWLVYDLSGHVTINFINTGPVNAVASGLMFDPVSGGPGKSTFNKADATTFGGWIGTYGSGGYSVIGGANNLPASVQLSVSGAQEYTWADPVADPRALQIGPGTQGRVAAALYSPSGFTLDLNLADGQPHNVVFYLLDFDALGRSEMVQVSDAATGTVLTDGIVSNFEGGKYLDYTLTGHVKIAFINYSPGTQANAVLSGIFIDPVPPPPTATASYIRTDFATEGAWTGVYGSQGYDVIGGAESLPSYASLTVNDAQFYQWATNPNDPTELQIAPGSTSRVAACDYSNASSFSINLGLFDGQQHQVALYLLDWDNRNRFESIRITDASSGANLASWDPSNFVTGQYLIFNMSGNVKITITHIGGVNEVVSGIFIDPVKAATASFVKTDATTQGTWTGTYGSGGYDLHPPDAYLNSAYANYSSYTYATNTTDPRALQSSPGSTSRVAAVDYGPYVFAYNLNLTDGKTHQLAIYVADYDAQGRSETIQLSDARTGQVLDTQFVSNFQGGKYLVWNVSGDLSITFTQVSGPNAVASGVFRD